MTVTPFLSFEESARALLDHLHDQLGFRLWMITRVQGEDWIMLETRDEEYGVHQGDVFRWEDSFCFRMVRGEGPRIAPVSSDVAAYASARIGQQIKIGSYVGMPIRTEGGELFGTLCAVDPSTRTQEIEKHEALLRLSARLLGTMVTMQAQVHEAQRRAENAEAESRRDPLTGVLNRRGWEEHLQTEESRSARLGSSACLIICDLDGLKRVNDTRGHEAGDALLRRAVGALQSSLRKYDQIARLGGDEFGILAPETGPVEGETLFHRVRTALAEAGIEASTGYAVRGHGTDMQHAWTAADSAMYDDKRRRRAGKG